ncbi:MAG: DUF342 domain-containing protein [Candidatus Kuenenia sp.]|nr:DUF342 domain-containing protein [Candidatus Kuenenia hertensis]
MSEFKSENRFFSIKVTDGAIKVFLTVYPFNDKEVEVTVDDILKFLKSKSIEFGIKEDAISFALGKARQENITVGNVLIAEGIRAIDGEDGKIEFLVEVNKQIKPKVNDDGKVDYYNVSVIENVEEKQILARLIDPTPGKPGKSVYKEPIAPVPGKPCNLPVGENTKISGKDSKLLISEIGGNVVYQGGVLSVKSCYVVEEDVDFSVGNITYKGSVVVKGNVKSGFCLNVDGNLEIGGTVEDAVINTNGNVLIKGGFVGSGKGIINSKGRVMIGFSRNQTIIAEEVKILREAIDCSIFAKNSVEVKGGRLSITGGQTTAGQIIEVETLGSRSETFTEIEVGIDYSNRKSLLNMKKEMNESANALNKIEKELNTLNEFKRGKGGDMSKFTKMYEYLTSQKEELKKKIKNLNEMNTVALKRLVVNKDAKVVVNRNVYPGVVIRIGENIMHIGEEYCDKSFFFSKEEDTIKMT